MRSQNVLTGWPIKKLKKLGNFQIVTLCLKKINILYQGNERPAKKKMVLAKLRAVLANLGFPQIFRKINI